VKYARARQFVEAVTAHDFEAAEELLDPGVETMTPRGTLRGIAACRQVLQKASGDEQFTMEQAEPQFEDVEGDVLARTREIARWRETGEVAYERGFALRLTLNNERIVRIVVMPRGALPSKSRSGSVADSIRRALGRRARLGQRPGMSPERGGSRTDRALGEDRCGKGLAP
jgi:hypothetical protein